MHKLCMIVHAWMIWHAGCAELVANACQNLAGARQSVHGWSALDVKSIVTLLQVLEAWYRWLTGQAESAASFADG